MSTLVYYTTISIVRKKCMLFQHAAGKISKWKRLQIWSHQKQTAANARWWITDIYSVYRYMSFVCKQTNKTYISNKAYPVGEKKTIICTYISSLWQHTNWCLGLPVHVSYNTVITNEIFITRKNISFKKMTYTPIN